MDPNSQPAFSSTVYFVPSGSSGHGLNLVKTLASVGNSVVITTAANPEMSIDLQNWVKNHSNVHVLKYDGSNESDADDVANQIIELTGGIDVVVNTRTW
ncbi:hypothetical protein AWJ20_3950 [Sugiyamaella lignohabitans]|uniref:Uncharacterized protein n=1 Tax=Sugiyamaella lignohabitans TaxID=796027 RepID=A0A167C2U1_9ASCO|nr:uncharacterized protein AWJ20_3950 [Sugiyamaella lignohabitans]ANB11150.1 hypothetical protein AWJ20_3950 [Sugiyamaella lignohabitans]